MKSCGVIVINPEREEGGRERKGGGKVRGSESVSE